MKYKALSLFIVIIGNNLAFSQPEYKDKEKEIYTVVEEPPRFPGGSDAYMIYLRKNLEYPINKIEGDVVLKFIVHEDGSISEINVVRSLANLYDDEAIRLVNNMPKWFPGREKGGNVKTYYILPIRFRLDDYFRMNGDSLEKIKRIPALYDGGAEAVEQFFIANLAIPNDIKSGMSKIKVHFTVLKNGDISDPEIINNPINGKVNNDILELIEKMSGWSPETVNGEEVDSIVKLSIALFNLSGDKSVKVTRW
ncbi:MAG: energy transducer TonB [Chitinophagales bacterium]